MQRNEESKRWKGKVVLLLKNELKKMAKEAWRYDIVPNGHIRFDVTCHEGTNYRVDLNKGACVFGQWKISGIPCKHASRCHLHFNYKLEDYTSSYYSVGMYNALHIVG